MTHNDKSIFNLYRKKSQAKSDEEKQKIQNKINQMWNNEVEKCVKLVLDNALWKTIRDSLSNESIKLIWEAIGDKDYGSATPYMTEDIIKRLKDYS